VAIFGRRSARQRLRSAARESLTIPTFSAPVDCSAWVLGGLWPVELAAITPETAQLADYLNSDLQRIANSANEKLHAIGRSGLAGQARQTAEARVINVARAFAVLRVESTVRQLHKEALEFCTEYVSLEAAPPSIEATEQLPPSDADQPRPSDPRREVGNHRAHAARHRRPEPVVVEPPADLTAPTPRLEPAPPPPAEPPSAPPPEPVAPSTTTAPPPPTPVRDVVETPEVVELDRTPERLVFGGVEEESPTTAIPAEPVVPPRAVPLAPPPAEPVDVSPAEPVAEAAEVPEDLIALVPRGPEPVPATREPSSAPAPPERSQPERTPLAVAESDEQRLQRLLAFVARQEPGLRWAIGSFADGRTLLVTDIANGWIPPGIELPDGVQLLQPGHRTGTATAMLGVPTASAAYSPGDRLGWASDFGATDASVRPRELAPIEDLGWQLGEATHWRDGLPRMANTLAKAGAAGTGVVDAEIDLLRVHLDTVRYQLLAEYPDTDAALLLNCMLLAATEGVATGDTVSANYHYSWFRELDSPPAGRWDPQS